MKKHLYAVGYVGAICTANYIVYVFGPASTPVNAFVLIGLDLVLRDKLHDNYGLTGASALAFLSAVASYALNPAAWIIALASAVAFISANLADGGVYHWLRRRPFLVRSNGSNIAGALVDSLVFPTIAFGTIMPDIVITQFIAKMSGGSLWSFIINKAEK